MFRCRGAANRLIGDGRPLCRLPDAAVAGGGHRTPHRRQYHFDDRDGQRLRDPADRTGLVPVCSADDVLVGQLVDDGPSVPTNPDSDGRQRRKFTTSVPGTRAGPFHAPGPYAPGGRLRTSPPRRNPAAPREPCHDTPPLAQHRRAERMRTKSPNTNRKASQPKDQAREREAPICGRGSAGPQPCPLPINKCPSRPEIK